MAVYRDRYGTILDIPWGEGRERKHHNLGDGDWNVAYSGLGHTYWASDSPGEGVQWATSVEEEQRFRDAIGGYPSGALLGRYLNDARSQWATADREANATRAAAERDAAHIRASGAATQGLASAQRATRNATDNVAPAAGRPDVDLNVSTDGSGGSSNPDQGQGRRRNLGGLSGAGIRL